jgi:hypothetical protein
MALSQRKKYDVFLSFRVAEAKEQAKRLQALLERRDVRCFACYDIEEGSSWMTRVAEGLEGSTLFVALGSKNYAPTENQVCSMVELVPLTHEALCWNQKYHT